MADPTVWLVRAGQSAAHVKQFLRGGFASLSWASIPGLGDLREHDEDEILTLLRAAEHRGYPAEDLRELLAFRDGMQVGDVVVTVDASARDVVFGDITGDYEFVRDPAVGDHHHIRPVTWFARWNRDLVEEEVGSEIRTYKRTVLELRNQEPWRTLAERVRTSGTPVKAPPPPRAARAKSTQARRPASKPRPAAAPKPAVSLLCASCGLIRAPSLFPAGSDVCVDCT